MADQVILVNEQDDVMGQMEKLAAHQHAMLHRAFSIMLYRTHQGALELLLQKRHPEKYHAGNLWTNTCCSHPRPGEATLDAASRRLKEELGLQVLLREIGTFRYVAQFANGLSEHELDHVFVAEYTDTPTDFDRTEISEVKWVNAKTLQDTLESEPWHYTPWLKAVVDLVILYTLDFK